MTITHQGSRLLSPTWPRLRLVAAAARDVLAWPLRAWRARQLLNQLGGLDDHELKDIGLTRQDLRDALSLPVDSDPTMLFQHRVRSRRRP